MWSNTCICFFSLVKVDYLSKHTKETSNEKNETKKQILMSLILSDKSNRLSQFNQDCYNQNFYFCSCRLYHYYTVYH